MGTILSLAVLLLARVAVVAANTLAMLLVVRLFARAWRHPALVAVDTAAAPITDWALGVVRRRVPRGDQLRERAVIGIGLLALLILRLVLAFPAGEIDLTSRPSRGAMAATTEDLA